MSSAIRERRTQDERSAATRRKLLDATVECLVEHGYAGTTTVRVAELAGVTRGAQTHHFATKTELVVAAVRHLAARRAEEAMASVAGIFAGPDPVDATLELIWRVHRGPVFVATVELWIAARTDEALREQLDAVEPEMIGAVEGFVNARFPDPAARQAVLGFLYTVMDTVRGLLISGLGPVSEPRLAARWERAKSDLRRLADVTRVRQLLARTAGGGWL